jgi:hypothetical protein
MINCRKAMATAAAVAGALLAGAAGSPAASATAFDGVTEPSARILSVVHRPGADVALVTVEYTCHDVGPFDHLWVSVKQGGADLDDEGSGERARAWYDSHPGQGDGQSGPTCDGESHTATFEVYRHPDSKPLNRSAAWVQFCLVQAGPEGPEGEPAEFLSESRWAPVNAAPAARVR